MAVQTGIEPAISCVTGRHVNRYTTGPFGCGDRTWTCDLRVMSPTSYQLLHPAMLYLNLIWRRKRDSNPRDALTPCRFSRPIPSARLGYSSILSIFSLVAEEGLEPPTSRVWTVRSSQLSYSAIYCYLLIFNWWRLGGSNPWPPACKAGALPAELILHLMVTRTGFEPVYACVKGMCVKPLHQRACSLNATSLVYHVCRFMSNTFFWHL